MAAIEFPQPAEDRAVEVFQDLMHNYDSKLLPLLCTATRQAYEEGAPLTLNETTWKIHAEAQKRLTVTQKARKTLEYIAKKSPRPGAVVGLNVIQDYPVSGAVHWEELELYLAHLAARDLITARRTMGPYQTSLTMAGWEELEPLRRNQVVLGRIFVARSFSAKLDEAYKLGIKAAIEDPEVGCHAIMLKDSRDPININNEMLAEITRAEFVIADLTEQRPNVYFEAGYAMALGRKVIFTCQADASESIHFDTAPFRRIPWTDPKHLFKELKHTLIWLRGRREAV